MSELVAAAYELALRAHRGQRDLQGVDYIAHPYRVAQRVFLGGGSAVHGAVAYLHDVVEDTEVTLEQLAELFPPEVVDAVDAITHRPTEPLVDYWARVRANDIARFVKHRDIEDNSAPWRLEALPEPTQRRLLKKYALARAAIGPRDRARPLQEIP